MRRTHSNSNCLYNVKNTRNFDLLIKTGWSIISLTSLRLRVVLHTKERIYYHLPEKKKGEERKTKEKGEKRKKKGEKRKEKGERRKEKGERRKECPIEAILNNHSVKLF